MRRGRVILSGYRGGMLIGSDLETVGAWIFDKSMCVCELWSSLLEKVEWLEI